MKALKTVLEPVKRFTASYIDEVAVYTNSWSMHLKMLTKFLQVIKQSGITFNLKKCQFALPEIKFIGHIIGSGRHCLDPSKASVIHEMKRPITKKDLRKTLGFLAHFHAYIPNYAAVSKVLTDLTCKSVSNKIPWNDIHQQAFEKLKQLLYEAVNNPLYIVDFNLPFNVSVDE